MILTQTQSRPGPTLLAENAEISQRFVDDGVDLSQVHAVSFMCDFPDVERARACMDQFGAALLEPANKLPEIISARFYDDKQGPLPILLTCELAMTFSVEDVSAIEFILHGLSRDFDGGAVSWEYQRPETIKETMN